MVKLIVFHVAPVPAWLPKTAIDPAMDMSDLHRLAVMVGNELVDPLTQIMKAPKFGTLIMFCAVEEMAI